MTEEKLKRRIEEVQDQLERNPHSIDTEEFRDRLERLEVLYQDLYGW